MIVFKVKTGKDENLEVNFCKDGLYIEIDRGDDYMVNIVIPNEDVFELIDYLNNYKNNGSAD